MIVLVLGGARSGKSEVAERLALEAAPPVTYVATIEVGEDADLGARVAAHRVRRPDSWRTLDAGGDLSGLIESLEGTVILDGLGAWLSTKADMHVDEARLCSALEKREGDTFVVSEEVGLGVHPATEAGRRFRDALGSLNQAVAGVCDEVLLVVAGRTLRLEKP